MAGASGAGFGIVGPNHDLSATSWDAFDVNFDDHVQCEQLDELQRSARNTVAETTASGYSYA